MDKNQIVRCPNCGSFAKRHFFSSSQTIYMKCPEEQLTQTECPSCDYLMVMCSLNGRVVEAYAPGRPNQIISRYPNADNPDNVSSVAQHISSAKTNSSPNQVTIYAI